MEPHLRSAHWMLRQAETADLLSVFDGDPLLRPASARARSFDLARAHPCALEAGTLRFLVERRIDSPLTLEEPIDLWDELDEPANERPRHWLEVQLCDENEQPRGGERFHVMLADGTELTGRLGEPTMFIFEATGTFHKCLLKSDGSEDHRFGFTVFGVRPFRWHAIDRVWFRREVTTSPDHVETESELRIGESASFGEGGRSRVREKHLLSITRVSEAAIRRGHLERRSFTPLVVHQTAAHRLGLEYEQVGYPTRAVPFPTLAESSADEGYATLEQARDTMNRHIPELRPELARFSGNAGPRRAPERG